MLTTPGIRGKLLGFGNFLPGSWKTPGKTYNFPLHLEIFWNFVEDFSSVLLANQNLQKHLTHDCTFCILAVATVAVKLIRLVLFLPRENLHLGPEKISSLPWRTS